MSGIMIVAERGGGRAPMLLHAEEDVDARSGWTGLRGIRSEVRDGITPYGVLLVVQGEDYLGGVL